MEPFDQVARRYLALQGVLFRAVEKDDKPVIMNLIQRIQTICDDTITLLSDRKEELVREQRLALEETQTKLNTELEKLQDLQAREESLREAQEKLDQEKKDLAERELAVEKGNQALQQSKDIFLADLEHRAKGETNRDKKRSLLDQDLDKKRSLLQQDLDQIKNDQAKIIKDQAKVIEDQVKVTQMQKKVIEDQTTVIRDHATLREKEQQFLEAREREKDENTNFKLQVEQQAIALEEKRKENQKDKTSLVALRSAQLQEARRKRARDEADNGPSFWHRTMKDAKEALDLFYVAKSCSMNANDLVPRLWDILENGSMYKRLLGFHNNAQPSNWRCLRTLVAKGSFVAKPLTDAGCSFHPSEKCLQVCIIEEEKGGRAMDFRMA